MARNSKGTSQTTPKTPSECAAGSCASGGFNDAVCAPHDTNLDDCLTWYCQAPAGDPVTGCYFPGIEPAGLSCNDGNPCTNPDNCFMGSCIGPNICP